MRIYGGYVDFWKFIKMETDWITEQWLNTKFMVKLREKLTKIYCYVEGC